MKSNIILLAAVLAVAAPVHAADAPLLVGDLKAVKAAVDGLRGKPVVLMFWATWCKPCIAELPELVKLHGEMAGDGVTFFAVSFDGFMFEEADAKKRILDVNAKYKVPWAGALVDDDPEKVDEAWKLGGVVPTTLFLDATGKEVERVQGMLGRDEAREILGKVMKGK